MQFGITRDARPRPRLLTPTFLLIMLSTLAYFTGVGAIIPTLPRFVKGPMASGEVAVGLVVGAFAVTAVLLRPYSGRLSDQRGRRLLIVLGGVLVGLSVLAYELATGLVVLVVLRLITGIGEAFFYVGVASVINDLAPDERRGEALSYFSLALFGGLAIGPVLGESVLEAFGYGWVWVVAGAASLIAGGLGFSVPETRPEGTGLGPQKLIHRAALLPGTVLATNIWALATWTSFVTLYALNLGMDGARSIFVLNSAVVLSIRLFGARLPDRLGPKVAGGSALICTVVGMAIIGVWGSGAGLYVGTFVWSVGHALAFPALMTLAVSRAPASERGAVVGTFTAFFDLSFGVGAVSAGWMAASLGYRGAFLGSAIVAALGLVLLLGYKQAGARSGASQPAVEPVEELAS